MYNCAQGKARQHKPKKGKTEAIKERDKDRMDSFDCCGYLGGDTTLIRFKHEDDHVPFGVLISLQRFKIMSVRLAVASRSMVMASIAPQL